MLHSPDDLFACGVHEPHDGTVCDIAIIDDLIIIGIVAAASIAASQVSAAEQKSAGKEKLDYFQQQQRKQQQLAYYKQQQDSAAASIASRHGGHGGTSQADALQPFVDKQASDTDYAYGMKQLDRQADATRTQGYIQAGTAAAQGIAGAALSPASSGASSFQAGTGYEGTGANIGDRAGGYDLNPASSALLSNAAPVATQQLHATDPGGGYQLQESDYATLGGAQAYSQGPFADDPYATASPYQNSNRYRFGI